jgi:aspartyl protease family protein
MIGWACRQLAIWGGLAVLLYAVAAHREMLMPRDDAPAVAAVATVAAPANPAQRVAGNSLTYRADKGGHFWVDAVVNGASVRFVVDTGATAVTLTQADAAAAGFNHGNLSYSVVTNTANGQGRAAPVRLREVRIGQLAIDDVPAWVTDHLHASLLGMSFLKRLERFEIGDGVLTIYWD